MPDDVIQDRLQLILDHEAVIGQRVASVQHEEEFFRSDGADILIDSLVLRLQALPENSRKIQHSDPAFFQQSLPIDVVPIIRFRDLISPHYEKLNPAMLFQICTFHVPFIASAIQHYLEKLT